MSGEAREGGVTEVALGILLEETWPADVDDADTGLDETGHVPASGRRGLHRAGAAHRIAVMGDEVLRSTALAIGHEVASVLAGVVAGLEEHAEDDSEPPGVGSFDIGEVELKFGVKAVLGAGRVVEALLTASGEATIEVTVRLRQRSANAGH